MKLPGIIKDTTMINEVIFAGTPAITAGFALHGELTTETALIAGFFISIVTGRRFLAKFLEKIERKTLSKAQDITVLILPIIQNLIGHHNMKISL